MARISTNTSFPDPKHTHHIVNTITKDRISSQRPFHFMLIWLRKRRQHSWGWQNVIPYFVVTSIWDEFFSTIPTYTHFFATIGDKLVVQASSLFMFEGKK